MNSHTACPLCDQLPETADHIALGCVFARQTWHGVLSRCGLEAATPNQNDKLIDWWPAERHRLHGLARKGFDSLVLLTVWILWKERNARVFEHRHASVAAVCQQINEEVGLWKLSGAVGLAHVWK